MLYDFYASRIPEEICRGASFESWRKKQEAANPQLLLLTKEDLLARTADEITDAAFPDLLTWKGISWQLKYNFAPSQLDDGVSMQVPVAMLSQLPETRLEWLVPGLLREKCLAMMRSLPKQVRKNFVPLPDYIDAALQALVPDELPLGKALGFFFYKTTGVKIDEQLWKGLELPDHLVMNFCVLSEKGEQLGQGRDLTQLRKKFAGQMQAATQALDSGQLKASGATDWNFGELPHVLEQQQAGVKIQAFPALIDEGKSVGITLFDSPAKAQFATEKGLVRLIRLSLPQKDKYLQTQLSGLDKLALMFTKIGSRQALLDDLINTSVREVFLAEKPEFWPRDEVAFQALIEKHQAAWILATTEKLKLVKAALEAQVPLAAKLKGKLDLATALTFQDAQKQLNRLFFVGFIWQAGSWLAHYPRYLKALEIRLEKASRDRLKDQRIAEELGILWHAWENRFMAMQQQGEVSPELADYRWLIEEYRVSLYAQQLGTQQVVSARRLADAWISLQN